MDRRKFLVIAGGGTLALAGGAGTLAVNRWNSAMAQATTPWDVAGTRFGDVRLDCLAYAILAPNPHNLQPWQIRLEGENALSLFCDANRHLPETDPPDRQLTIGFGTFIELMRMAAAHFGHSLAVTPFPEGEPFPNLDHRPVAHITFQQGDVQADPLFDYVLTRRTNRQNFAVQPLPPSALLDLIASTPHAHYAAQPEDVASIKAIAMQAWEIETQTARTRRESVDLTRIGAAEIAENPDGVSLSGPIMEGMRLTGLLTRKDMDTPGTAAYQGTLDFYNGLIESASAFVWLTSTGNSRADQLSTGRDWLRLNLTATKLGLGFHPLSQALQEFPEMAAPYAALHEMLGVRAPARIQGLFRVGHAPAQGPAPRWPMKTHIL